MTFLIISGFFPEPNPDDSLQYKKAVPPELEMDVLAAMGWKSQDDLPQGVTDLTHEQVVAVMTLFGDPIKHELIYCVGRYR
jgi:hypothetical protein